MTHLVDMYFKCKYQEELGYMILKTLVRREIYVLGKSRKY